MGEPPVYPSRMRGDNKASHFVMTNNSIWPRTKHLHIRERFVTDLIQEGKLELQHVGTEDNPADVGSKNVKVSLHDKHKEAIYDGKFSLPKKEDVELSSETESWIAVPSRRKRKGKNKWKRARVHFSI